ncbi:MAG: ATP-binding protein [bacterium]|nr:ATP-binding protein [bacterium]
MLELSMHVLDALQNSVDAGATRIELRIEEDPVADRLTITVKDNGRGMAPELRARVLDPFVTTRRTRRVGLGLPLLAAAARQCEGDLTIESAPNRGTRLEAAFRASHIDRAPLGDMPATVLAILMAPRVVDVDYTHRIGEREYHFDSAEVRKELDGAPITDPSVMRWLNETLRDGEAELEGESEKGKPRT